MVGRGLAIAATEREQLWQDRLAGPVLLAALASVPAVFLTLLGEPMSTWGRWANLVAGAILLVEPVVLLAVSADKRAWLRRNWWLLLLGVLVLLTVVFALGPFQVLRLLRAVGALRVIRVGRIVKAGRILGRRSSSGPGRWPALGASVLVAVFVVLVLADPTSTTRTLLEQVLPDGWQTPVTVLAGLVLAGATFVVVRNRDRSGVGEQGGERGGEQSGERGSAVPGEPDANASG